MKQIFITLFSLALSLLAHGQNKKIMTKTIDYETYASYTNIDGKATYSYYEDENFREVNHGKFHYTRNFASNTEKRVGSIIGMFKNGLRDGLWTFNFHDNGWVGRGSDGHKYFEMKFSLSMNYRNGIPVGQLSYSYTSKDIVKYNNGVVKTQITDDESVNTILNKNGDPSEYITFKTKDNNLKTYKLDMNGFLIDGRFTINEPYNPSQSNYVTENSLLTKLVVNGNIKSEIPSEEYRLMYNQARNEKDSSLLDMKNLEIKKESIRVGYLFNGFNSYARFLNLQPFYGEANKEYKKKYTNFFIHYNVIGEIKKIPYTQNPKWPDWENYTEYEQAIQDCTDFLNSEARVTSEKDIERIKNLIKELEQGFELEKKGEIENKRKEEYDRYYTSILELTDIPELNKNKENQNQLLRRAHYSITQEQKRKIFEFYVQHSKKLFFQYNRHTYDSLTENGYNDGNNVMSLEVSLNNAKEYLDFIKLRIQDKDSLVYINSLIYSALRDLDNVEDLYVSVTGTMNVYTTPKTTINKPKIWYPYLDVIQYLYRMSFATDSFNELYYCVQSINDLCEFMPSIYNTKTKELEKELSSASSIVDQHEIFKRYMNKSGLRN